MSNGNGVNRMARALGEYLSTREFFPVRFTNADNFNQPKTSIYYGSGYQAQAHQLSMHLPESASIKMLTQLSREDAVIRLVIGEKPSALQFSVSNL